MKLACAAALAALLLPTIGWSQTPAAPDPERLRLARQIFEAQGGLANMTAVIKGAMASMAQSAAPQPGDTDFQKAVMTASNAAMIRMLPRLLDDMATVYANNFDETELKGILAFYQTPTGKALVAKLPQVGAQTAGAMGKMMPAMQLSVLESVCASMTCPATALDRLAKLKDAVPAGQRF